MGFNYINITNNPTTATYLTLYVTYIITPHKGIQESLGFWNRESNNQIGWTPDFVSTDSRFKALHFKSFPLDTAYLDISFNSVFRNCQKYITIKVSVNLKKIRIDVLKENNLTQIVRFSILQSWIRYFSDMMKEWSWCKLNSRLTGVEFIVLL